MHLRDLNLMRKLLSILSYLFIFRAIQSGLKTEFILDYILYKELDGIILT